MSHYRAEAAVPDAPVAIPALVLCLLLAACAGGGAKDTPPPAPKRFPVPLFDGLWLGMTREEAAGAHPIRPALTSAGRNRLVWIYDRPGEYTAELEFGANRSDAKLERIDVHFGANEAAAPRTIESLTRSLGEPEALRRKATTNAYCDRSHEQVDTIYSDATQYVFVTECVPAEGRRGPSLHYISVKKKELVPKGPPTGYVPPPPPKGKDGKPVEEQPF